MADYMVLMWIPSALVWIRRMLSVFRSFSAGFVHIRAPGPRGTVAWVLDLSSRAAMGNAQDRGTVTRSPASGCLKSASNSKDVLPADSLDRCNSKPDNEFMNTRENTHNPWLNQKASQPTTNQSTNNQPTERPTNQPANKQKTEQQNNQ